MWKLLFLLIAIVGVRFGKSNEIVKEPKLKNFSKFYTVKGVMNIPYAEIHEPFTTWYDPPTSSRTDYYGGMVKTIQLANPPNGVSFKIVPVTTEKAKNVMTCFMLPGTEHNKVHPQSILPNISDYEYAGKDMVNGFKCDKWTKTQTFEERVTRFTVWTRTLNISGKEVLIPVKLDKKVNNILSGSFYDYYSIDFESFSPEKPPEDVFSVKNYTCQSLRGPPSKHIYTFNPIKEFVDNYDDHVKDAFEEFKKTYNKDYKDKDEHSKRLSVFRQNMRFIHSHNRKNLGYTLAVNHLADRDTLELKALRGMKYVPGVKNQGLPFPYSPDEWTEIPESIDWRINGAVTPVKNQFQCGSCWSFGATGAIEGAYFLKHNKLVSLSEQALIDCSWGFRNTGCDGGFTFMSYDWVMKHGIPTEDAYGPYLGQDGYCHLEDKMEKVKIEGYVNVTPEDEKALRLAVAFHGPVSVGIDASHLTFAFYSSGVYYDPNCGNKPNELNHAVLVVGYGTLYGEDYWLVKNSWSFNWGNDGYILMSRRDNNCGVTTVPNYVIM